MTNLVSFSTGNKCRPGALRDGRVLDLSSIASTTPFGDLISIVEGGDAMMRAVEQAVSDWSGPDYLLDDVRLEAPIRRPSKIIGIGLNYIDHCREAGLDVPEEPVVFSKYSTSVSGPYDDIHWDPALCTQVDYEIELGVVIGKEATRVPESDAFDHVFGYTVVNDVSARNLQFRGPGQWDLGKCVDEFCPYGPGIITKGDIADPQNLDLRLSVNGEERQSSNTSNMIFGIASLIAFLSRTMTLLPGDLIATGTPFGVALGMKPPVWLKDGDICEGEIEQIGTIRNTMRERV